MAVAVVPAVLLFYFIHSVWAAAGIAVVAGLVAWCSTEFFVLRHIRTLLQTAERLGSDDPGARAALPAGSGEVALLANEMGRVATALEQRAKDHEQNAQRSLNRALQQTAVAALGQFALTTNDFSALLSQAATLISQTLEVPFCRILELMPGGETMLMRAGTGWKKGITGVAVVNADPRSQAGFTLTSGEPVVISDLRREMRFSSDPILGEHRVVSGVSVSIVTRGEPYGVLAVYTSRRREFNSDDVQFLLAVANALAIAVQHSRAEAELRKVADFARLNPNPAMELNASGEITYFNDAASNMAQYLGRNHPAEVLPPDFTREVHACLSSGRSRQHMESRIDNHVLSWSLHPMVSNGVVHCYVTDITDRLNLEAQLRQSQKMESVGQLAAGVAHDFNNMLTVIQGHAGMLMTRKSLPAELRDSVQSVSFAAERAASLTRQLLMFSRKSVMQPKLIDLREVVSNMMKMLKRLLGETIVLDFQPPKEMLLVEADPAMAEQVIMNLSVNARDAMAMGGKLSIRIDSVAIEDDYVESHPDSYAGNFVRLHFVDTGHGMKPSTMARIFEPFFTTKEAGKGTGLGLATVYGIVKQHKGWIEVASEYGKGTRFSIYFPATSETAMISRKSDLLAAEVRGGTETILLVEDEPSVLAMGRLILQDCGYNVLEAGSGIDALRIWAEFGETIDLLFTDIVMPNGISGADLALRLMAEKPELKVLFASGYCVEQFDTDFIRQQPGAFLQKPYTRYTLAQAIRQRLDQGVMNSELAAAGDLPGPY